MEKGGQKLRVLLPEWRGQDRRLHPASSPPAFHCDGWRKPATVLMRQAHGLSKRRTFMPNSVEVQTGSMPFLLCRVACEV